jgi:hypothetical protein
MLFSLFSPSLLLLRDARVDAGGLWNARRLQALVQYGEGPNVTGLTLCMLAIALLHVALSRRTAAWGFAAALALAAVPATSWPATIALVLALACYVLAMRWAGIREIAPRMVLIGLMAAALALPFALPSTVSATFSNANSMGDGPSPGNVRWLAEFVLIAAVIIVRSITSRLPFALRFAVLYSTSLAGIVLAGSWLGVRMVPQPLRFHLAWEIGLVLVVACLFHLLSARWPMAQFPITVLLLVFWGTQVMHYRQYARHIVRPVEISETLEFQTAVWLEANMPEDRIASGGTVSFWMNLFSSTPQLNGCCDQSIINEQTRTANYIIQAGFGSNLESADYSILWMKAFAVHAIALGGSGTRDRYKPFQFPERYRGTLPLAWQQGDDYIYRVPARVPGLARVVRAAALVVRPPANGIDVAELRTFVAALDDASLPTVETEWRGSNEAVIRGTLQGNHVVSVAINHHRGWRATATVNGQAVPVRKDGLGLLVIEPGCSGACEITLRWSPGWEPALALLSALGALIGGLVWIWREKKSPDEMERLAWGIRGGS